jgi:exopolysaccharide biosynthesis polyprenyl glycosylphosphotransferase
MFRRFSVNFALLSMAFDVVLVCLALALATHMRPQLGFLSFAADYPRVVDPPAILYPVFAAQWVGILLLFSIYNGRRNLRRIDEWNSLTIASVVAGVSMAGTLYLSYREVSRLLFIVFVLLAYLAMFAWREVTHYLLSLRLSRPEKQRRVLIIGAGPVGCELHKQIQANPQLGLKVAGFLDDRSLLKESPAVILGPLSSATQVVETLHIDDIVIALPQRAYRRLDQLVTELHRLPVKIWVIPDYFRLALHKAAIEEFAGIPMLDLRAPALSDYQRMVKRAFDLCVTLLSMPIALPLMGLIGLAIRIESHGPVLFHQARAGENGRIFKMLKFRTMQANAEKLLPMVETMDAQGNIIHKSSNDPRVTRLGRFLRRTSLDEIPQLINVIKGEMSLVGPRPELPYLVDKYEPWQRQRFAIPQGMTGWWQINGRSNKPLHLNTEFDLYYVQHYSLLLDIYILLKTLEVVWRGEGAF